MKEGTREVRDVGYRWRLWRGGEEGLNHKTTKPLDFSLDFAGFGRSQGVEEGVDEVRDAACGWRLRRGGEARWSKAERRTAKRRGVAGRRGELVGVWPLTARGSVCHPLSCCQRALEASTRLVTRTNSLIKQQHGAPPPVLSYRI